MDYSVKDNDDNTFTIVDPYHCVDVLTAKIEDVLNSLKGTDVVDHGENDLTHTLYMCLHCEDDSIQAGMKYCPNCGYKINEFLFRCYSRIAKKQPMEDDKPLEYEIQCDLPDEHDGNHKAHNWMTNRQNTWTEKQAVN